MNTQTTTPATGFTDLENAMRSSCNEGTKVEPQTPVMTAGKPILSRNAIKLHTDRGDQDILVKFYGYRDKIRKLLPKGFNEFDGVRNQDEKDSKHALAAVNLGETDKAFAGRLRPGVKDTADFKMEEHGRLRPAFIFKDLMNEGFKVLRIVFYRKVRQVEEAARIHEKHGQSEDQYVLEFRLTHESVYQDRYADFKAKGYNDLEPAGELIQSFKDLVCSSEWGACNVFSNNTATKHPSITVNFRNSAKGDRVKELTMQDGKIQWV